MIDWKGETGDRVAEMRNSGMSIGNIAKALGLGRGAVCAGLSRLRERGMITRQKPEPLTAWPEARVNRLKELWAAGLSAAEISNEMGESFFAIKARIGRLHAKNLIEKRTSGPQVGGERSLWTAEQEEMLVTAWNRDKASKEIAAMVGRTVKAVESKVRKLIIAGRCKPAAGHRYIAERPKTVNGLRIIEQRRDGFERVGKSALAEMESADPGTGKPIIELGRSECRWPTGGFAPQFLFCGNTIDDGAKSSYCRACRPRAGSGYSWRYEPKTASRTHVEAA